MRTPLGIECKYFYGNYFRGRSEEECRLIGRRAPLGAWTPDLCKDCPVPSITRDNACENMILTGKVEHYFLGLKRKVRITAFCKLSNKPVKDPHIGCGICHPLPDIFLEKES